MREYLFRGKPKRSKEWRYWDVFGRMGEKGSSTINPEAFNLKTIGQSTGIFDKTHKKIFEGDIIRCTIWAQSKIFIVRYSVAEGGFELRSKEGNYRISTTATQAYEIIGNAIDNPDLRRKYEGD